MSLATSRSMHLLDEVGRLSTQTPRGCRDDSVLPVEPDANLIEIGSFPT